MDRRDALKHTVCSVRWALIHSDWTTRPRRIYAHFQERAFAIHRLTEREIVGRKNESDGYGRWLWPGRSQKKIIMNKSGLLTISAVIALTGSLYAQGLSTAEKAFVSTAAKGNLAEVELGKLASQKSGNDQVKAFGEQMVTDHSKANDNLKPIADSNGVTWPDKLTGEPKALYDRLSKLSGKAFDKVYVHAMVEDHMKDAKAYETESGKVKDAQLKSYVDQTLPVVQQHLSHIQNIQQSQPGASKKTTSR